MQGEQYNPDAEYVPELKGVDPDVIYSWQEHSAAEWADLAPEYPVPIVDHAAQRERALATFECARGD